ncbi:PHO85 cyclin-5 [Basidiobolus ranarum]|uniref:PHO85 cyclin-5 n=1 Tax=Basidiobolus ranarum TaxID=34480 RepID=A0ABR2W0S2_9FUNG
MIIESIWSNHSASTKTKILPLRVFIRETLQRSRTSFSTLQTALFYLFRVKDLIPRAGSISSTVKDMGLSSTPPMSPIISVFDIGGDGIGMPTTAFPFPSPPLTPAQVINHGTASQDTSSSTNGKTQSSYGSLDPVYCARRMFLASLIVASKFLQDRNYSNKAWAKITGLSSSEINHNEIAFLRLIDYRLFIPPPAFARWSSMLINYINHSQAAKAANATRGDTNDSSSTGPSAAAQFNSELTTSCLNSNPVQCRTDSTQTGASVPLNITLPCRNSRKGTTGQMSSQCQDKPTINQVNMLSPSILDPVGNKKPINNCLMAEYHANPAQCLSTLPNCAQSNTHPSGSSSPYLVQESTVSKVRYIRECISNIRNQQCSSEQQQLTSRNANDMMQHNQSGVRPALGYRSKSRIEISPYPTTPVRSKSSSYFNESNHNLCLSQPTRFVASNQVLPIPDVEGEKGLN